LVRPADRVTVSSYRHDPVRALAPVPVPVLPAAGIPLGDVLADSGYAHRDATPGRCRWSGCTRGWCC
jgi:hypothetical protein